MVLEKGGTFTCTFNLFTEKTLLRSLSNAEGYLEEMGNAVSYSEQLKGILTSHS